MVKQRAIVLRKKLNQLIILDSQLGKIKVFSAVETICVGALIDYQRVPKKHALITDIETIFVPLDLAHDDIAFLHHVLELLFYFLVDNVPVPDIFDLICFLYAHTTRPLRLLFKKVFIVKVLLACGEYPEDEKFQLSYFHTLLTESVDNIVNRGLDSRFERCLDEWLLKCIAVHPNVEQFKTIYFLVESRVT